jgi:hypothetical protein
MSEQELNKNKCIFCPKINSCLYAAASDSIKKYCCELFKTMSEFPNASDPVKAFYLKKSSKYYVNQKLLLITQSQLN